MLKERKIAAFIDVYNTMLSARDFDSILKQIDAMGEIYCCKIYGVSDTNNREIVDEIVRRGYDMAPQLAQNAGRGKFDIRIIVDTMETVLQNTNIDVVAIICAPADLVWFFRKLKSYNVGIITGANGRPESLRLADVTISSPALTQTEFEPERIVGQAGRRSAAQFEQEDGERKEPIYISRQEPLQAEPIKKYIRPIPLRDEPEEEEEEFAEQIQPQSKPEKQPLPAPEKEPQPKIEKEPAYEADKKAPEPEQAPSPPIKKPEPPSGKKDKTAAKSKAAQNRNKEAEGVSVTQYYEVDLSRYQTIKNPNASTAQAAQQPPATPPAAARTKKAAAPAEPAPQPVPAIPAEPQPTEPEAVPPVVADSPSAPPPQVQTPPAPAAPAVMPPQEHKPLRAWSLEEERPDLTDEATNAELLEEIRKLLEEFK